MRTSRTAKAVLTRLLCVLCVLLMLTACSSVDDADAPISTAVETTEAVLTTQAAETEAVQTLPEQTLPTGEAVDPEAVEPATETLAEETAELNTTEPTQAVEETISKEVQLSEELLAAQQENQRMQKELDDLTQQQEKNQKTVIILAAAAAVILIAALLFLYFWRHAAAALKKARKRNHRMELDVPISQIYVGKTHGIGGRSSQQDSFSVSPTELYEQNGVLAVVADGMGGLENGDKASQAAVISAMESFYQITGTGTERLLQMLSVAKAAVNTVQADLGTSECGTTLLMGLIQNGEFYYISVGDSRIYLYRAGRLIQLNREHSYLYDQLHMAVNGKVGMREAIANEKNGCITSYLGMQEIAHIDIPANAVSILPKDKFLLMSDGVYNALTQEEICLAMRHPAQDAAEAIKSFIATKNFQDQDNYTLVILECR